MFLTETPSPASKYGNVISIWINTVSQKDKVVVHSMPCEHETSATHPVKMFI